MAKPAHRSYSRYSRIKRKVAVVDVAERPGISRGLVHRIEDGEMRASIDAAFEVAAIVGLPAMPPS